MRNLIKNKKKKGFTLIEMVAVVAIIGILAAILVPKITGYMDEAKKTAVINQARQVVQAAEAAQMKGAKAASFSGQSVKDLKKAGDVGKFNEFLNNADTSKIEDMVYETCVSIVNNNIDFSIDKDGNYTTP